MKRTAVLCFWAGVFLVFLTTMELGDFWWHLSTGKWIWQHKALPGADPFSITSTGSAREPFVLKGFWLFQLGAYLIHKISGLKGITIAKSLLFALTFLAVERTMKSAGTNALIRHLLIVPVIFLATYYDECRPQTASFLFFALVLLLLEAGRRPVEKGQAPSKHPALLIAIIPLWANVHPGFIIGVALIGACLAEASILSALKKRIEPPGIFIPACIAAIALSLLNPNGLEALTRVVEMLKGASAGTTRIHEHTSVARFAELTSQPYLLPIIAGITIAGLLSFIPRIRRPDLLHLALFCALSYLSFKTFRAGLFFAILGTVVIGSNLSTLEWPSRPRQPYVYIAACTIIILFSYSVLLPRTILKKPVMDQRMFPVKISAFVEEKSLPPNIYHPYEWGGYLTWRLYPSYKVFIDGRALGSLAENSEVLSAGKDWREILARRNVNTVIYWPLLPYKGSVPPLVFALLEDREWDAAYWDLQSIAFARKGHYSGPTIKKGAVWELLSSLIAANIKAEPRQARHYSALGELRLRMGLLAEAREAFGAALSLDPTDSKARFWLESLTKPGE